MKLLNFLFGIVTGIFLTAFGIGLWTHFNGSAWELLFFYMLVLVLYAATAAEIS